MKWIKRFTLATLLLVTVLLGAVELARHYFKPENYHTQIERLIRDEYGFKFAFDRLNVSFLPSFGVMLHKVSLEKEGFAVSAGSMTLKLSLTSAFTKDFEINAIELVNPIITLKRFKDGTWNFQKIAQSVQRPKEGTFGAIKKISVIGGDIIITDEYITDSPVSHRLNRANFNFRAQSLTKPLSFNLAADLLGEHQPTKLRINLSSKIDPLKGDWKNSPVEGSIFLDKINPENFRKYLHGFFPETYMAKNYSVELGLSGAFSEGIEFDGAIYMRPKEFKRIPVLSSGPTPSQRRFEVRGRLDSSRFDFHHIAVQLPEISLSGRMAVDNYMEKEPNISFRLDTSTIDISKLGKLFPPSRKPSPIIDFMRANVVKGKFLMTDVGFNGPLSRITTLGPEDLGILTGKMEVKNFELKLKEFRRHVENINGLLLIKDGKLNFSGINAMYGKNQLKNVKGTIDNIGKAPFLKANVDADIDLKDLYSELLARIKSPELLAVFRPVKDLKGKIKFNFNVAAGLQNPEKFDFNGDLTLSEVSFVHDFFDMPVEKLNGIVHLNESDIDIGHITWTTGSAWFETSGKIKDYSSKDYNFDLRFDATGNISEFARTRIYSFPILKQVNGPLHTRLDLKGDLDDLDFNYWVDFTNAEYSYGPFFHKRVGVPLQGSVKGRLFKRNSLDVESANLQVGKSSLLISGKVADIAVFDDYDLKIFMNSLKIEDLTDLSPVFADGSSEGVVGGNVHLLKRHGVTSYDYNFKTDIKKFHFDGLGGIDSPVNFKKVKPVGMASGRLEISGKSGSFPVITGQAEIVDFGFKSKMAKRFDGLTGTANFKGNKVTFKDVPARLGASHGFISGDVTIKDNPRFVITVDGDNVDFDDIFDLDRKPGKKEKIFPSVEFEWDVIIKAKNGNLHLFDYTGLEVRFTNFMDDYDIKSFDFDSNEGKWHAAGKINTHGSNQKFSGDVEVANLNLTKFLPELWPKLDKINGRLEAKGNFSGSGFKWEKLRKNISGEMEFSARQGSIEKYKGLTSLFKFINITPMFKGNVKESQKVGLPYETITGRLKIKDGIGHTENISMEGDVVRMSAVGDFNFADGTIDLFLGVKPFTTLDKIVSSIPIAGSILTGVGKSLITAYFSVKGPMEEPHSSTVASETIGRNIFGIVKRLLGFKEEKPGDTPPQPRKKTGARKSQSSQRGVGNK